MFFNYEGNYVPMTEGYNLEDANELVIESYINDYTIFEAALRRDFMEATGILSEAADDNFLTKIWNKIVEFVEMIQEKIMALVKKFEAKMDESKKKKAKKIVDDYKKYYNGNTDYLNDFSIKNFKLKTSLIAKAGEVSALELKHLMSEEDLKTLESFPYVDQMTKETIDSYKETLDDVNFSDVKEKVEKVLYEDDEIENPFSSNSGTIVSGLQEVILKNTANIRSIKNSKADFMKDINKCKKDAKKKLSEIRKDKYSSKETKDDEKEKAHAYLSMLSALKRVLSGLFSYILKEVGNIYKESVRLYKAGGEYLKRKQESAKKMKTGKDNSGEEFDPVLNPKGNSDGLEESYTNIDFNTAIGEMAVFELGLDFDL